MRAPQRPTRNRMLELGRVPSAYQRILVCMPRRDLAQKRPASSRRRWRDESQKSKLGHPPNGGVPRRGKEDLVISRTARKKFGAPALRFLPALFAAKDHETLSPARCTFGPTESAHSFLVRKKGEEPPADLLLAEERLDNLAETS